jgi:hypothetical protein
MKTIKSHGWSNVNIDTFTEADFDTGDESVMLELRSVNGPADNGLHRISIHGLQNIISLRKYLEKLEQKYLR